jgi:hypothetical protein
MIAYETTLGGQINAGFAALLFALFLGYAGSAAAQCTSVPCMTIKIYNNSDTYNIYPVLSSGTAVTDVFLQAALMVPKAQLGAKPFPKLNQFRLYINPPGDGIPPHGKVKITLLLRRYRFHAGRDGPTRIRRLAATPTRCIPSPWR